MCQFMNCPQFVCTFLKIKESFFVGLRGKPPLFLLVLAFAARLHGHVNKIPECRPANSGITVRGFMCHTFSNQEVLPLARSNKVK